MHGSVQIHWTRGWGNSTRDKVFASQVYGLQFRSLKPTGELAEVGRVTMLSHRTGDRGRDLPGKQASYNSWIVGLGFRKSPYFNKHSGECWKKTVDVPTPTPEWTGRQACVHMHTTYEQGDRHVCIRTPCVNSQTGVCVYIHTTCEQADRHVRILTEKNVRR